MTNKHNNYTAMQLNTYNALASEWSIDNPNPVVGSFHEHNSWEDYKYLFESISDTKNMVALDFACGPGRNIVKYRDKFKKVDGVDISPINIKNAELYLSHSGVTDSSLFVSNGMDLDVINGESYDLVLSTIALQHICVHEIRYSIFQEIYRVLKRNGIFTAQMGYGSPSPSTVGYYDNHYNAAGTNRACDVCIESPEQLKKDLLQIGFSNFNYTIGNTGPGDCHPNWIYFNVKK